MPSPAAAFRRRACLLAGPAVALPLLLAGCGAKPTGTLTQVTAGPTATDAGNRGATPTPGVPSSSSPTASDPPTVATASLPAVSGKLGAKPKIAKATGAAPSTLKVADIATGTGSGAQPGQVLTVQYVGQLYANGKQFDASWDHGQPFAFTLGAGMVIGGWDQGLLGMKVGGRRELVIPSELGYMAAGYPPTIPGNATLVFVVDLVSIS